MQEPGVVHVAHTARHVVHKPDTTWPRQFDVVGLQLVEEGATFHEFRHCVQRAAWGQSQWPPELVCMDAARCARSRCAARSWQRTVKYATAHNAVMKIIFTSGRAEVKGGECTLACTWELLAYSIIEALTYTERIEHDAHQRDDTWVAQATVHSRLLHKLSGLVHPPHEVKLLDGDDGAPPLSKHHLSRGAGRHIAEDAYVGPGDDETSLHKRHSAARVGL